MNLAVNLASEAENGTREPLDYGCVCLTRCPDNVGQQARPSHRWHVTNEQRQRCGSARLAQPGSFRPKSVKQRGHRGANRSHLAKHATRARRRPMPALRRGRVARLGGEAVRFGGRRSRAKCAGAGT